MLFCICYILSSHAGYNEGLCVLECDTMEFSILIPVFWRNKSYPEDGGKSFLQNGTYIKKAILKMRIHQLDWQTSTSPPVASHLAFFVDRSITEDALHSFQSQGSTHPATQRHIPEDLNPQQYHCGDYKSCTLGRWFQQIAL
jgi:hypothetical protein